MISPVDPNSAVFLLADSRSTPMHVGALQLFHPPAGAGGEFARQLYEHFLSSVDVAPLFRRYPYRGTGTLGTWFWRDDDQLDLEHHVRHSALPRPGRVRELLELVSRLHGARLAEDRPLWECHVIEGLADGRVGIYMKVHHATIDGVSAMRLLQKVLSSDPDERGLPAPWAKRPAPRSEPERSSLPAVPLGAARQALGIAADAAGLPRALAGSVARGLRSDPGPLSFSAPPSILNGRITGARRFAADDVALDRLRAIGTATGTTINDVVLTMCAGALRRYLLERDSLPDAPLIAMVPVSLHARGSGQREGGNAFGSVMVPLATDVADPVERLGRIQHSMSEAKEGLGSMTPMQVLAMSGLGVSPVLLTTVLKGGVRLPFNVTISNVPGPRERRYLNGAELDGMYPLSIPFHGQGLNITCMSYADQLAFGLTGCRRTVPHLQRLLGALTDELDDLEATVG